MSPLVFFRCAICRREFDNREAAEGCEAAHLTAVTATVRQYGIHEYPYSVLVTFSNGETREYVADQMR